MFHLSVDQDGGRGITDIGVAKVGVMELEVAGNRERLCCRSSITPIDSNRDVLLARTTKITADGGLSQSGDLRSDDVEQQGRGVGDRPTCRLDHNIVHNGVLNGRWRGVWILAAQHNVVRSSQQNLARTHGGHV